jgi:predicted nucleic acid-binding protein
LSVLYVDTSALARIYLVDDPDARALATLLLDGDREVATSELSDVELARAIKTAERGRRIASADRVLRTVQRHLGSAVALVPLNPGAVLPSARRIVLEHRVRTLDAIHLAVALDLRVAAEDDLTFVTRDAGQAAAAEALGLPVL